MMAREFQKNLTDTGAAAVSVGVSSWIHQQIHPTQPLTIISTCTSGHTQFSKLSKPATGRHLSAKVDHHCFDVLLHQSQSMHSHAASTTLDE
jgi:hypothetical protein